MSIFFFEVDGDKGQLGQECQEDHKTVRQQERGIVFAPVCQSGREHKQDGPTDQQTAGAERDDVRLVVNEIERVGQEQDTNNQ